MFRPPACNVGQGYTPVMHELFHHADAYKGSPLPFFHIKTGRLTYLGRASKKDEEGFRGAGEAREPGRLGGRGGSGAPRASLFSLSVPRALFPSAWVPLGPPVFSLTGSTMVPRRRTWMWRQYSLQRVGSFPVNSFPQLTLPGESWLTCFGRLLTGQPRP